jgi:hypothetical protein
VARDTKTIAKGHFEERFHNYMRFAVTGGDAGVTAGAGNSRLTAFIKRASWQVAHGQHKMHLKRGSVK